VITTKHNYYNASVVLPAATGGTYSTTDSLLTLHQVDRLRRDLDVMVAISEWIDQYLVRPHPDLGRTGAVCPFASGARQRDLIRIAVFRRYEAKTSAEITEIVRRHKLEFVYCRQGLGEDRIFSATMMAFPDVSAAEAPDLFDGTREALKPEFVREGLMLGEFHANNHHSGLHNEEFHPLRSPIPMLVIRHMVPSDIVFLSKPHDSAADRVDFLTSYLACQNQLSAADRAHAEGLLQAAARECTLGQLNG
jgi:hypothetical protein